MDISTARSRLVHETRARLGETATIRARVVGDMSALPDVDRATMKDLAVRFDVDPSLQVLGDRDVGGAKRHFAGRAVTASVPRDALQWLPRQGDQVEVTSLAHEPIFTVVRVADDLPQVVLLYLSADGLRS